MFTGYDVSLDIRYFGSVDGLSLAFVLQVITCADF